jgi:hypothetical protein
MKKSDGYETGSRWTFHGKPYVVDRPSSSAFGYVYVHFAGMSSAIETVDLLDDPNWVYVGPPEDEK